MSAKTYFPNFIKIFYTFDLNTISISQKVYLKKYKKVSILLLLISFSFPLYSQSNWRCIEGDCENGTGVSIDDKGIRYEGTFSAGVKSGKGRQVDDQGNIYSGEWKNDFPNGKGTYLVKGGEKYSGTFSQGLYHGNGVIIYPNGDRYTGQFKKDKRSGYGSMLYLSERKLYVGKWSKDKPHGSGVIYTLSSAKSIKYNKGVPREK